MPDVTTSVAVEADLRQVRNTIRGQTKEVRSAAESQAAAMAKAQVKQVFDARRASRDQIRSANRVRDAYLGVSNALQLDFGPLAQVRRIMESLERIDLSDLRNGLPRIVDQAAKAGPALGAAGGALAVLGSAVASVKAQVGSAKWLAELATEQSRITAATGLSAKTLAGFELAVARSGNRVDGAAESLTKFSQRLGDARLKGGEGLQMFKALGVDVREFEGSAGDVDQTLLRVFERLGQMEDGAARARIGTELLGRSGYRAAAGLNFERDAILDAMGAVDDYGSVLDAEVLALGGEWDAQNAELAAGLQGIKVALASELAPVAIEVLGQVTDLVIGWNESLQRNRPIVAAVVAGLADLVSPLDNIKEIGDAFERIEGSLGDIARKLVPTAEALAAVLDPDLTLDERAAAAERALTALRDVGDDVGRTLADVGVIGREALTVPPNVFGLPGALNAAQDAYLDAARAKDAFASAGGGGGGGGFVSEEERRRAEQLARELDRARAAIEKTATAAGEDQLSAIERIRAGYAGQRAEVEALIAKFPDLGVVGEDAIEQLNARELREVNAALAEMRAEVSADVAALEQLGAGFAQVGAGDPLLALAAETDAALAELTAYYDEALARAEAAGQQTLELTATYQAAQTEVLRESARRRAAIAAEEHAAMMDSIQASLESVLGSASQVIQTVSDDRVRASLERAATLQEALEENEGRISAATRARVEDQISAEKKAAKQAFEVKRIAAVTDVILSGFVSGIKALEAGPVAGAFAAAAVAAKVAASLANIRAMSPPSFHTGGAIIGPRLQRDEGVITARENEFMSSSLGVQTLARAGITPTDLERANRGQAPAGGQVIRSQFMLGHRVLGEWVTDVRKGGGSPLHDWIDGNRDFRS